MTPQEIIDFKLIPALKECELHQARMNSAWVEAVKFGGCSGGTSVRPVRCKKLD
jgi:hypothetical protein